MEVPALDGPAHAVPAPRGVPARGITGDARPSGPSGPVTGGVPVASPAAASSWDWFHSRSLPPTMKQRILAEAHGKSPNCRHLPLTDAEAAEQACDLEDEDEEEAEPSIPLQR
ncbi:DUF6344 domain-containing protein [Streptomyces sp. NBC_00582]|nr:DUF6344 domain-containing protein [Streptomyces sp. NBC_00582]WUB68026.1 DUF6344 domain-containing protein [Streptomyces sp. NBC_00582]